MDKKYDVLTSGYVSMDHMVKIKTPAEVGFTSLISNKSNTDIYYGGCGVNVACALSRLGMSSMPMIRVGSDYEEIGFKAFLEENNIKTDAIKKVDGDITSVCYLVQDNEGQHITLFYPGSMDGKYFAPLDDCYFKNTRMGVITVGARCDNEEFFKKCKKNDVPLVFGMKGDMDAFPKDFLFELLNYCKIIFTNEYEREAIEELYSKKMTDYLFEGNAEIIITTLGKKGSCCYVRNGDKVEEIYVPICKVGGDIVVDTTGSGDAFVSGFVYGYLNEMSIKQSAQLGTVLSSFVIEKEGCCTNAPDLETLMARYNLFVKETDQ